MCHPTAGELSGGRADRLLSGLRFRRRMRLGGHVLHLYRWVSARGARRRSPDPATAIARRPGEACASFLLNATSKMVEQQMRRIGVELSKCTTTGRQRTIWQLENPVQHASFPDGTGPFRSPMIPQLHTTRAEHGSRHRGPAATRGFGAVRSSRIAPWRHAGCGPGAARAFLHSPSFRRFPQITVDGGVISAGANRTKTRGTEHQTSVIVSVTASGNVTNCSN